MQFCAVDVLYLQLSTWSHLQWVLGTQSDLVYSLPREVAVRAVVTIIVATCSVWSPQLAHITHYSSDYYFLFVSKHIYDHEFCKVLKYQKWLPRSIKLTGNCTFWQSGYDFRLVFHYKYVSIFYCFQDIPISLCCALKYLIALKDSRNRRSHWFSITVFSFADNMCSTFQGTDVS